MSDTTLYPAFPVPGSIHAGMSLRDYFAAKAMQSVILDPWYANQERSFKETGEYIANDAYVLADAMLKARQQ